MIHYKALGFSTILLLVITYTSCKHTQGDAEENKIKFDTLSVSDYYHIDNDSTMPSCNLKLTYVYPTEYKNSSAILDSLQNIFISSFLDPSYSIFKSAPQQALEKYKEDYIIGYQDDINTFYKYKESDHELNEKYLSYYETIENKIVYNKKDILSFQISQTNYKGGTSSYLLIKNYAVDLITGKIIFEEDIFKGDYEKVLSEIFKEHLLKENKVKKTSDLENMGYFGIDEIVPNENLLLDDKYVTYTFNKGEYSTYKLDPITIKIPYEKIRSIINIDSPVYKFLDN